MQSNNAAPALCGLAPSPQAVFQKYAAERDRVRGEVTSIFAAVCGPFSPGPSPRCAGRGEPNPIAILLALILALSCAPAFAQRDLKDIPTPDPELERQALQLGEGLEINLYAADPLLAKPIQMNFDAQGRLWIATSETYPQIEPGKKANDKIIVLEDADRDGRADKTHVFADGLLIPTGIEPGDGGAYVANSTELLHFTDEDGDLKADGKRTLLSGFGTEDTHHILHTLRWGPDGRLYMNQSIYIHSHIETPYGVRRLNGGGIWQYDPRTHRLEIFARGWVNAWGHAFDKWGNSFVTDGAGGEGINYAFPGAVYPTAPGAPRVLHGMNPGSPKYCGLEIISGPHWPDDWQGDLITCDFRAHRVVRFKVAENGSGYTAREVPELIKTTHVAFRPIDIKLGPDGALYIADWYNPIIQHGEVDFRDPRRDHTHGRIWRVTVKGRKPAAWPYQVQRPEIDPIYAAERTESGPNVLLKKMDDPDHHVRAAAVRVAGSVVKPDTDLYVGLTTRAIDENAQVRLEAICALRNVRRPETIASALQALDRPMDENLDFALWQTCREQKEVWLPAVLNGMSSLCGDTKQLEFALRAVDEPTIVPPLLKLLDGGKVADDRRDGILTLIARLGGPQELAMIFERVLESPNQDAALQRSLLAALAEAAITRKARPAGDLSLMDELLEAHDDGVAAGAAKLLGLWKVEASREQLVQLAKRGTEPTGKHLAAVSALADLEGDASRRILDDLSTASNAPKMRQAAATALVRLDPVAAAKQTVSLLSSPGVTSAEIDIAAIISEFVTRAGAAVQLRTALAEVKLPPDVAKIAIRAALAAAKPDDALVAALRKAGGIAGTGLQLSPEQTLELVSEIKTRGDGARGEAIYLRKDLGCTKCHAIGGAGGKVGPDLISIGASAQVDYLVDSLVVPNKAVKEGYHTAIVELDDGRVLNGVKVRQTDKDLILRDAEDRELNVPLNSIESQAPGMSLMPAGLVDNLTRDELIDLVRFLSELGKIGPYQLSQAKLVRRWETLTLTKDSYEVVRRQGIGAVAGGDRRLIWEPQFTRIDGTLRLETLPAFAAVQNTFMSVPPYSVVRFAFDVAADGDVDLQIGDVTGLQAWLDGKPIELKSTTKLTVAAGRRTLTLVVDRKSRSAPLRCELIDVAGSAAAARPISVP
jgi:putative heme-binding domain-containing protein